tara:strand:- start:1468 stop:1875 length:408 start_codon:yes stop_codon:yes gene_type:complete
MADNVIGTHKKAQRVDTEDLFKQIQWDAMRQGVYKYQNLDPYRNCIEQMEILAEGSGLLNNEYWTSKKTLRTQIDDNIQKISTYLRPGLVKSRKNDQVKQQLQEQEISFCLKWHRLLMKYLAPMFYTRFGVSQIK